MRKYSLSLCLAKIIYTAGFLMKKYSLNSYLANMGKRVLKPKKTLRRVKKKRARKAGKKRRRRNTKKVSCGTQTRKRCSRRRRKR